MASGYSTGQHSLILGPQLSNDTMRVQPIKHNKLPQGPGKIHETWKYYYKITINLKFKINKFWKILNIKILNVAKHTVSVLKNHLRTQENCIAFPQ